MAVLLYGGLIFLLGFLAHLLLWRIRLPRRQTRALLIVFALTSAGGLAFLLIFTEQLMGLRLPVPHSVWEYAHIMLMLCALLPAYIITYSALEADSPSLVMVMAVAAAGSAGLRQERFAEMMNDELLIVPRVQDLVRDKLALCEGGRYRLTGKGRRFIQIFVFYRWLLDLPRGG